jgi:hypothetical protein
MFSQDMADVIIFGNNVGIWNSRDNEKVKIRLQSDPKELMVFPYRSGLSPHHPHEDDLRGS